MSCLPGSGAVRLCFFQTITVKQSWSGSACIRVAVPVRPWVDCKQSWSRLFEKLRVEVAGGEAAVERRCRSYHDGHVRFWKAQDCKLKGADPMGVL